MQSKATTVKQYLAELPADRRAAISTVRDVILKNLDKDYEEGMQYGMIGYYVPHRVYPGGYHCDPRQPLPFMGLGSQKNNMSVYLMCVYGHEVTRKWFEDSWKKTGKKLDMGKACLRFKKAEDLALDVLGEVIRRVPVKKYVEHYEALLSTTKKGKATLASKNASAKKAVGAKKNKPARKPIAQKRTAKKRK